MYRQSSCLYQYSAYILNIGTYSDSYTSIGATLIIQLYIKSCGKHQRGGPLDHKYLARGIIEPTARHFDHILCIHLLCIQFSLKYWRFIGFNRKCPTYMYSHWLFPYHCIQCLHITSSLFPPVLSVDDCISGYMYMRFGQHSLISVVKKCFSE